MFKHVLSYIGLRRRLIQGHVTPQGEYVPGPGANAGPDAGVHTKPGTAEFKAALHLACFREWTSFTELRQLVSEKEVALFNKVFSALGAYFRKRPRVQSERQWLSGKTSMHCVMSSAMLLYCLSCYQIRSRK